MSAAPQSSLSGSGQEIFEALRDDIVFGRLNPRERLVEADLVQRFDSHRAAVREALLALEQAGLVDRQRNKGASVRDLNPEQVAQIYAIRVMLETEAINRLTLPFPSEALDALVAIQHEHEAAVRARDLRRLFDWNDRFHRLLYTQSGNPLLVELIEQFATRALTVRFHPYTDDAFLDKVCADHWAMIDACRAGDRDTLLALVHEHLPLAKDRYLDTYSRMLVQDDMAVDASAPIDFKAFAATGRIDDQAL